jgi:hypothetical protein
MSVTYNTTLKNTRMTDVVTAIDAGTPPGYLEIGTSAMGAVLATIYFNSTAGTVSGGVLTFSGTPLTCSSAAGTGTAAAADVKNAAGTAIISGLTVGTSASDINLSSTAIVTGEPVTLTAASITHG